MFFRIFYGLNCKVTWLSTNVCMWVNKKQRIPFMLQCVWCVCWRQWKKNAQWRNEMALLSKKFWCVIYKFEISINQEEKYIVRIYKCWLFVFLAFKRPFLIIVSESEISIIKITQSCCVDEDTWSITSTKQPKDQVVLNINRPTFLSM